MVTTRLYRSAPYWPVADVARTVTCYERTMGFTTEYVGGSPPEFAMCAGDGLANMFRQVPGHYVMVPVRAQGGTSDAFFWVENADALCAELRAAGALIVDGPSRQEAYGMMEFAVRDPDGHVLGFGQPVALQSTGS